MNNYAGLYIQLKEELDPEVALPAPLDEHVFTHWEHPRNWYINYAIKDARGHDIIDHCVPITRKIDLSLLDEQRAALRADPRVKSVLDFLQNTHGQEFATLEFGIFVWDED